MGIHRVDQLLKQLAKDLTRNVERFDELFFVYYNMNIRRCCILFFHRKGIIVLYIIIIIDFLIDQLDRTVYHLDKLADRDGHIYEIFVHADEIFNQFSILMKLLTILMKNLTLITKRFCYALEPSRNSLLSSSMMKILAII